MSMHRDAIEAFAAAHPEIAVALDAPLARYTTFGIGGPADGLVFAPSTSKLSEILNHFQQAQVPVTILGGGSNVLIADKGVRGVVIRLAGELCDIEVRDRGRAILVGAGVKFPRLTRTAIDAGWPSAVGWMGTPGQVGGALIMNAGTRDGELGEVVEAVEIVHAGKTEWLDHEACGFSYRNSNFPHLSVLTRARLRCDSRRSEEAKELSEHAKALLKKRHATQPRQRSAGSIFKNPEGDYAGRLIEAVGMKGRTLGNAMISDVHANFLVNVGGATAADIITLANAAAAAVKAQFGVELRWEVKRIGDFSA